MLFLVHDPLPRDGYPTRFVVKGNDEVRRPSACSTRVAVSVHWIGCHHGLLHLIELLTADTLLPSPVPSSSSRIYPIRWRISAFIELSFLFFIFYFDITDRAELGYTPAWTPPIFFVVRFSLFGLVYRQKSGCVLHLVHLGREAHPMAIPTSWGPDLVAMLDFPPWLWLAHGGKVVVVAGGPWGKPGGKWQCP
jgi:hypothetical protein